MNTRIERIIAVMKKEGVRQLVISNPKTIEYLEDLYVDPGERMYVLLLKDNGEEILFLNNLFNTSVKENIRTMLFDDTDNYVAMLVREMYCEGKVGIDGNWPARFLLPLMKHLSNCQFENGSLIVDKIRKCKDEQEQKAMIESSKINDEVICEAIKLANKGYSEIELANIIKEMYIKKSCSDVSFSPIVSFGKNAANPHHEPDDTKGKEGDCLVIDIGGLYHNYCSDMTRTVFLGKASEKALQIYNIVKEANLRGIAAAKAGNKMSDVDKAARDYIESKGYGQYFTHRTGHSIGMEVHEPGDVSKTNDSIIEVGQVFSIEPGIYIPQEGIGVRIEDLVLISEDGNRVLNSYSKELQII